jgi:hypothetical protein
MKRNEILGEIKANPDYLRAAERSRSQARDAQRTFGKSPEEKAAARRTEIKRDKGIQGYSKRHRKENPDMYPKVKPRDDMKTSSGPQDWYGQNRYMGDSVNQSVAESPSANKTDIAMAYLMAVVNAPMGTSEKRRLSNWQQILDYKFDIEMDTAALAQLLPQLDSQLQSGKLDKLQNRMISRGELSIESVQQGVAESYPKHQDLSGVSTDKLKAYLAKQAKQSVPGEGGQVKRVQAELQRRSQGVAEGLDEGRSDYVGDAIEGLRMAKPGLEKEDFLDELYSYIDAEMGMEAAERAFADKDSYDDWYDSYADAMDENANMLKVAKDDDKQTILQNPGTGVQTQIDKTNPNAPSLTKDEATGKLKLAAPAQGGAADVKPNLVGKDVEVATESADLTAMLRIAGLR